MSVLLLLPQGRAQNEVERVIIPGGLTNEKVAKNKCINLKYEEKTLPSNLWTIVNEIFLLVSFLSSAQLSFSQ